MTKWILALFPLSLIAHASADSHFEQIHDMFSSDDSVQVSAEELEGFWSGRCFAYNRQNTPIASILIGHAVTADVGPGLPSRTRRYTVSYVEGPNMYSVPANYFDNPSETVKAEVREYTSWRLVSQVLGESRIEKKQLYQYYPATNGWDEHYQRFVRNGQNIVTKQTVYKRMGGIYSPGQIMDTLRCYYFQRLDLNSSHL